MHYSMPLLLPVCILLGCSATPVQQPTSAVERLHRVLVKPYRMAPVLVPVTREGATLRSTVCDAYDSASRNGDLAASYLISEPNLTGLTPSDLENMSDGVTTLEESSLPGEKFVVLLRGPQRMFFYEDLVFHTDLGSVRVLPGDQVVTLSLNAVQTIFRADAGGQYTVRLVGKGDSAYSASNLGNIFQLSAAVQNAKLISPSDLTPNVAVLTRAHTAVIDTLIIPSLSLGEGAPHSELLDKNLFEKISVIELTDGDVVEFTRLETIPIVVLGMTTPRPPRVGDVPTPTSQRNGLANRMQFHDHQLGSGSMLKNPLLTFSP